jgi:hypothetical protein
LSAYTDSTDEEKESPPDSMDFELIGRITSVETIAVGRAIRDVQHLNREYGRGYWRKLKGFALVRDKETGETYRAEVHWYEATGIGRKEFKIKRPLEGR